MYLCWLAMWFGAILGLKINLNKSELSWDCLRDDLEVFVDDIGCKVGSC